MTYAGVKANTGIKIVYSIFMLVTGLETQPSNTPNVRERGANALPSELQTR